MRKVLNLSRPCDACGESIGGGYAHCPKCDIWLCFLCQWYMINTGQKLQLKCPMCGEDLSN